MAIKPVGDCAPITQNATIIEFLLDETGSMGSCERETVEGFNDFLNEQKEMKTDTCLLTLSKFSTSSVSVPYSDISLDMVPEMQPGWFIPGGGTNLLDTINSRLISVQTRIELWKDKPNVLMVIMTDGQDNASCISEDTIRARLQHFMELGWTFVYLGADQNALPIASRLGFPEGNIKSFAKAEMRNTMRDVATATTAYRATRASTSATEQRYFK